MTLQALFNFVIAHWTQAFTGAVIALGVACVCVMPEKRPRTLDEWWAWMRDTMQTAVPTARHTIHPSTPVTPAQPKQ